MAATTAPTAAQPPPAPAEHPLRPDVFLSYSRVDHAFVQRLAAALEAAGKDVWVDLDDIRKGADWHAAMLAGIESARVVVPVLTPDFAASEPCAEEVDHAVAHNKRLLPILRRPVERRALRTELTTWNWISFDGDDRFDTALRELLDAVETDGDWLDEHARLLVRALEWKRADERTRPSLLLRGGDLRAAEDWLAAAGAHREQPTSEHTEYLVASRRAETRRQRFTLGGVAAALAVSVALSIFALIQRSHAIAQSRVATSRELAARANDARDDDPELALLLAHQAARKAATPEAETALRQALDASHVRVRLTHREPVVHAVFAPDGKTILTGSEDGTARLWRASDGKALAILRGQGEEIKSVAFRPDGRYAVTTSYTGKGEKAWVQVWTLPGGDLAGTWTQSDFGADAHFDRTGRLLLTRSFLGRTHIWRFSLGTWYPLRSFPTPTTLGAASDDFSRDGRHLVESVNDRAAEAGSPESNFARIWDRRTGEKVVDLRGRDALGRTARFSPDGRFVVTTGFDNVAKIWSADAGKPRTTLRGHNSTVVDAEYSRDGRLVVTASDDGTARVWDAQTGRELLVLRRHGAPLATAHLSPDGRRVVTASEDGTARVWALGPVLPPPTRGSVTATTIAFSADGTVAVVGGVRRASIWDAARARRVAVVELPIVAPVSVAVAPNGGAVIVENSATGEAKIWDRGAGRTVASFIHLAGVDPHSFDATGRRVARTGKTATASACGTCARSDTSSASPIPPVTRSTSRR